MTNHLRALYARENRWVNWELRNTKKIPIDPNTGRLAKSDDPSTWATYEQAKANSDKIGIMLGLVDKYRNYKGGYHLCGIDLDGCLSGDRLRPEAREVVDRFRCYTEVSPSGRGVHIIFAVNTKDIEKIRETFGIVHRKSFSIGPHQEIALDLSNRYYTVTEDEYNDYDLIDSVKLGDLEWFVRDAGPAFQGKFAKDGGVNYERDDSRSGYAFRFFMHGISKGKSEEELIAEIKTRRDPAGEWARTKGKDVREMQRVFANALRAIETKGMNGHDAADYLTSKLASEIEIKAIRWMWPSYFAYGKLGMIVGDPDGGKSTVALDMAARVSRGGKWPDKSERAPRGDVLVLNAEDDKADTVVPRLIAAGADLKRIRLLEMKSGKMFSLSENLKMLDDHITKGTRLVIIDPVTAYLGVGKVDSFRGTDVRGTLGPLVELAERKGVLVLLVTHFNKNSKVENVMHRITDSQAFGAICRHIYAVLVDQDNDEMRLFLKARNSVAPSGQGEGLAYSIETVNLGDRIVTSRIKWEQLGTPITADEAMKTRKTESSARSDATEFLRSELEKGPVLCAKLVEKAELRNTARRTLYRAAEVLNINKINSPEGVLWSLPAT